MVSADADILGEELDDAHEAKLHLMLEGARGEDVHLEAFLRVSTAGRRWRRPAPRSRRGSATYYWVFAAYVEVDVWLFDICGLMVIVLWT